MACCCIRACNDDTEKKKRLILVITKGYGVRASTIKGQNAFAPRCALRKFHVTDGQNTRDKITSDRRSRRAYARDRIVFCAFHSFLVEVQTHTGYIHATNA